MHTHQYEAMLADIDDNIADAALLGDERELVRLQNHRMDIMKQWQEMAGL